VENVFDIAGRQVKSCDFIIVNLNHNGSQGTSHELAIARENDISVIGLCDMDKIDSIHPFDKECVDKICNTVDELIDYVSYYHLV